MRDYKRIKPIKNCKGNFRFHYKYKGRNELRDYKRRKLKDKYLILLKELGITDENGTE